MEVGAAVSTCVATNSARSSSWVDPPSEPLLTQATFGGEWLSAFMEASGRACADHAGRR